jgi:hypothetical protein
MWGTREVVSVNFIRDGREEQIDWLTDWLDWESLK